MKSAHDSVLDSVKNTNYKILILSESSGNLKTCPNPNAFSVQHLWHPGYPHYYFGDNRTQKQFKPDNTPDKSVLNSVKNCC